MTSGQKEFESKLAFFKTFIDLNFFLSGCRPPFSNMKVKRVFSISIKESCF